MQAQAAAQAQAWAQAIAASEDAQCRSYGAEPGSYVQCRMNFSNQRAAAQDANDRAIAMQYLLNRR